MSRHPVTPMREADLARHLAQQTARPIGLVDTLALRGDAAARLHAVQEAGAEIVSLDALDEPTLAAAGGLIWRHRGDRLFAIGSQGIEYALIAHWREAGLLPPAAPVPSAAPVAQIAAVSASCAPVTEAQIRNAEAAGFATLRVDPALAVDEAAWTGELERAGDLALAAAAQGRSVLAYTALGPEDPSIAATGAAIAACGLPADAVNARIGGGLGRLLARIMAEVEITRGVIAGGDTSGHAAQSLGIRALTAQAPIAPGAPLCRAHGKAGGQAIREFVFKGGQMGGPEFFRDVQTGFSSG
jgi:uncharacterized protein YgbK (DUF1537 family)